MDLIGIAPNLPSPGETVIGDHFFTAPGGKGANQAVAAARMCANVRMAGRVGKDSFGPTLLAHLRSYGIDVWGVAEDPDNASGIAIILLDSQRQNHIVAIYGANAACDETQLDATKMALEGADALMLQLEIPSQVSLAAARYAKTKGIRVILDPAPAQPLPPDAFTAIDILTPNQTEAEFYTDIDVADSESAKAAAESLLGMGLNIAVVKMGAQGAYYASHSEAGPVPSYEVEVKDTVAAGDTFGTGLVIALCEGKGLPDGVRHGTASGALAVTRPGTQEAMPSRDEVEALLGNS